MKCLVFSIGCLCFGLVFVIERLGGIFSIGIAFTGIFAGTLLGLFTMGMLSTRFNSHGALWGSVVSLVVVGIIAFGAQANIFEEKLRYPTLPFNVGQCSNLNRTDILNPR